MALKHACFISYRHKLDAGAQRIVQGFKEALATQVATYIPHMDVYLDEDRLCGGDLFNQSLAQAICESCCMVVLVEPYYFDIRSNYCAREYRAMELLEQRRLAALGADAQQHGLVLPVVVRGEVPPVISDTRQYFEFDRVLLQPSDFRRRRTVERIHRIAKCVFDRQMLLATSGWSEECHEFKIPSEDDIQQWLVGVTRGLAPFPSLLGS